MLVRIILQCVQHPSSLLVYVFLETLTVLLEGIDLINTLQYILHIRMYPHCI